MAAHAKHKTDRRKLLLLAVAAIGAFLIIRRLRGGAASVATVPALDPNATLTDPYAAADTSGSGADLSSLQGELDTFGARQDVFGAQIDTLTSQSQTPGADTPPPVSSAPPPASDPPPVPPPQTFRPIQTTTGTLFIDRGSLTTVQKTQVAAAGLLPGVPKPAVASTSTSHVPATTKTPAVSNLHRPGVQM